MVLNEQVTCFYNAKMMHVFHSFIHITPASSFSDDMTLDNISEEEDDILNEEIAFMENNSTCGYSEEEWESDPIPIVDILNRFCLKIKEEALISTKTVDRIREATISLLKATAVQTKCQVCRILQKGHGIDSESMPELDDVFSPFFIAAWIL